MSKFLPNNHLCYVFKVALLDKRIFYELVHSNRVSLKIKLLNCLYMNTLERNLCYEILDAFNFSSLLVLKVIFMRNVLFYIFKLVGKQCFSLDGNAYAFILLIIFQ